MAKRELIVGYPVNEFTRSENLFGGLYFLNMKGGLDRWASYIKGGFLEQHFQQFSEILQIMDSREGLETFRKKIEGYRKHDLDVIMHAPFIRAHDPEGFLEFDFEWLVVPESYNKNRKSSNINCLEARIEDEKRAVDLASEAGVKVLTMHVTSPGFFLNDAEWADYTQKIVEIVKYIQSTDKGVTLAIETGGVMPSQMEKLYDDVKKSTDYEIAFNLDTAHLLLDFMHYTKIQLISQGVDPQEAKTRVEAMVSRFNDDVIGFYKRNKEKIKVVHLTQTGLWADLHLGIEDKLGILTCNDEITRDANLDYQQSGFKRYLMVESAPSEKGIQRFIRAKENGLAGHSDLEQDETLLLFIGRPGSGKSEALQILRDNGYILEQANIIPTDAIREKYAKEAFSFNIWVPREQRQIVYEDSFRRTELALRLKQGTVLDATFGQRSNRDRVYNMALQNRVKDFYIFDFYCGEEEAKQRIAQRNEAILQLSKTGRHEGSFSMRNPVFYHQFSVEFQDVDLGSEFRGDDNMQIHIIRVDTTTNSPAITILNPDQRSRSMAGALKAHYFKKYNSDYSIQELDR